jgi:hypothetical protein
MGEFPNLIKIQIIDENNKKLVSNIAIIIRLYAKRKNDYYFSFLSDNIGIVETPKLILQKKILQEKSMFIMDYSSDLEDCKLKIGIGIMSTDEIAHTIYYMNNVKRYLEYDQKDIVKYSNSENYRYESVNKIFYLNKLTDMNITFTIKQL